MQRVREDKLREVSAGHDGTWVAHPGLVPVAKAVFDELHAEAKPDSHARRTALAHHRRETCWNVPHGDITEAGLRRNIDVALQYLESWLRGNGCVPIYNLMEDAATAEISRAQFWQWIRYRAGLTTDARSQPPCTIRF